MFLLAFSMSARANEVRCWMKGSSSFPLYGRTSLDYRTGDQARAEEAAHAAAEMREPLPVPGNGHLLFHVERITPETADPSNQVVIITAEDGTELLRVEPQHQLASTPIGSGLNSQYWWSTIAVEVPDSVTTPFAVHLADKVEALRCNWAVNKYGAVTLAK